MGGREWRECECECQCQCERENENESVGVSVSVSVACVKDVYPKHRGRSGSRERKKGGCSEEESKERKRTREAILLEGSLFL